MDDLLDGSVRLSTPIDPGTDLSCPCRCSKCQCGCYGGAIQEMDWDMDYVNTDNTNYNEWNLRYL
jgi:hypothetical protein